MINIQVALADSTDYNPAQFPELQLRQGWHQAGSRLTSESGSRELDSLSWTCGPTLAKARQISYKPFVSYWEESIQQVRAQQPNKRFVERVARDLLVHDVVLPYHLHEVRLRSETIQQRPGFSASAERLLQVSQEDLPATVNSEDDALNRIQALYTTFEYVGVLAFCKSQVLSGKHVGGAFAFIQALEMRQETPDLHFIVQADSRIRKKVHKLMTEDRHLFPTFAVALHHTLLHERNIWTEVRMEILHGSQRAANRVATAGGEFPEEERPRSSTQHQQEGWKQFSAAWQ